jgi:hypothetical protein
LAIRLIESFDHYNDQTELQRKGWSYSAAVDTNLTFVSGRFTGTALRFYNTGGSPTQLSLIKTLPSNEDVIYGGIAVYYTPSIPYVGGYHFADAGTRQIGFVINTNGSISAVKGGNGGTVLATTAVNKVIVSTWVHISFEAKIHGSTGTIKLWVNGELLIDISSQNTQQSANAYANQVYLDFRPGQSITVDIDDVYAGDDTGSINTTCPTEARVNTIYPTSSGTNNGWSYFGTTYAWQAVDESAPDDDTTYIYSSTSGTKSSFVFGDLEADADNVYALQFVSYGRKDDADIRATRFLMGVPAGTFYEFGTGSYMGSSYQYYTYIQETDPITAGALTPTIVNDNEYGLVVSL